MRLGQADVFVEVEEGDFAPVNPFLADERVEELELRGAGRRDHARPAALVIAMTDILGVNPLDPSWSGADSSTSDALSALEALVADRLAARTAARSARDYATSDAIRDQLVAAGITIEDTSTGARWSLTRGRGE